MDFNKLFDTYSNNVSTSERSNRFSQIESLDQLSDVNDFVSDFNSNSDSDDQNELPENDNENFTPDSVISNDIFDAISELDTPDPLEQNTNLNEEDEGRDFFDSDTFSESDEDETSELENFDFSDTPDIEDDLDLADSSNILEDQDFKEENNDSSLEDPQNENFAIDETENLEIPTEDNELNIDNIINSLEDETENISQDFDEEETNTLFEENEDNAFNDTNTFDIELPEQFDDTSSDFIDEDDEELLSSDNEEEELPLLSDDDKESETIPLPDFSKTELSSTAISETNELEESSPLEYETVDKNINFDVWENNKVTPISSNLNLSEEQIFVIRSQINSLADKDIRFKIREIVSDPKSYSDFYDQLISLLLIDSSEDSIKKLLEQIGSSQYVDNAQLVNIPQFRSSFTAHDVADYQDTIYRIKNELTYNIKRFLFYGIVILLSGTIAWLGIAQPLQINSIFKRGLVEIRQDNFIEGEALFQQASAVAERPIAEWYIKYADVYRDKNLLTEAENKYLSALAIEPKNITIATHVSDFYTNLDPKYYTNAIMIMDSLSSYHPKKFEIWDYLGSLFINQSDFFIDDRAKQTELLYEAADVYQEFILNNIKNPAPYYKMMDIYIRIGNKEQIDKIFQLITSLNPKYINIDIINKLAKYYTDNRNLNRSERLFRQVTPMLDTYSQNIPELQKIMDTQYNISPQNISNILSDSYYEFARYKMVSSDIKGAGLLLTNAILFNPKQKDAYNLLGELHLRTGDNNSANLIKAQDLFNQSLEIDPNNYKPHINLGHLYYLWDSEFGNIEQAHNTALYHYKLAKALMPPNIKNYLLSYNYGWLAYNNNNSPDAIESWSDIYKEDPNNPLLAYALGSALFKMDNPQLAQIELSKAIDFFEVLKEKIPQPDLNNKRHREIYTRLAKAYNNIGVINANYGIANADRTDYFDSQALLNFYNAQDLADQLNSIYSVAEYNIGVITRPNIRNRKTVFDEEIPKQTTIENPVSAFNTLLLESV